MQSPLIKALIEQDSQSILWWQMVLRALIIFCYALVMLRLFGRRIFGKNSTLDTVVAIILGSILSRALTGNTPLGPTLAASTALILIHSGLDKLAAFNGTAGKILKGMPVELASNGEIHRDVSRKASVSDGDLLEVMRYVRGKRTLQDLDSAFLERNGTISIITRDRSFEKTKPEIPSHAR